MSLDWRIQNLIDARELLRAVYEDVPNDCDVDKALRSASLSTLP